MLLWSRLTLCRGFRTALPYYQSFDMDTDRERKPLPVSTGSFRRIQRDNFLYVDKTRQIASLARRGNPYIFLARPRRFGKTLLVSTLEALFRGQAELFAGTWISQSGWPWTPHPVIRLDMTEWRTENARLLEADLRWQMIRLFQEHDLVLPSADVGVQILFSELIRQLAAASGRGAVVLIDEYDAPILQNLEHPKVLRKIRDFLRGFYGILKARDEDLRFVLLTGVTHFARTIIFSGLNNLRDISGLPAYSDLVGFTEPELETCLKTHMESMAHCMGCTPAALRDRLRTWYDGYLFAEGGLRVYNPFSVLNCLENQQFGNYWAESGTLTFLTRLFARQQHSLQDLLGLRADRILTATYNVTHPSLPAVMYQTGYLTIQAGDSGRHETVMPNREVEQTFGQSLWDTYTHGAPALSKLLARLGAALQRQDFAAFLAAFNVLLQHIPYDIQSRRERYYQLLLHLVFLLLGHETGSERSTHRGCLDTVVELPDAVIILEYKLDGTAEAALRQIERRGYHLPYQAPGRTVVGLGVNFDSQTRQATAWQAQDLSRTGVPT